VDGHDYEVVAQEVSGLNEKVSDLLRRMAEVERVNARLESAALTTSRALQEISHHWDAVYEAMRRAEEETSTVEQLEHEQYGANDD
jgi:negative regulator of replication initiation